MGSPVLVIDRAGWAVHQPLSDYNGDWHSACDDVAGRVDPDTGLCHQCGKPACVVCGREACPDHESVLNLDSRVRVIAGDLVGETGVVVNWRFAELRYGHEPSDPRVYYVEPDGSWGGVPFLRRQLEAIA